MKGATRDGNVICDTPQAVARAVSPRLGDVIVRANGGTSFDVVDAATLKPLSDRFVTLDAALAVARLQGQTIWRQTFDREGRAIDGPTPLDC